MPVRVDGSTKPLASDSGLELVVMFGSPGCGKSTLCTTQFPTYKRINQVGGERGSCRRCTWRHHCAFVTCDRTH